MYLECWPRLYRYAASLARNREDAEDVACEAIRRAYEAWVAGRGPSGDGLPWLFLIAHRVVIDRNKRRSVTWLPIQEGDGQAGAQEGLGYLETSEWFSGLRRQLSQKQYEAIVLRYLFDLGDVQIGRIMGLSAGGVRTNVSRGLATLRKRPEVLEQ